MKGLFVSLTAQNAGEMNGGSAARIRHVHMRIGAIGDEEIGHLDHSRRDIAVEIEARDEGNAGTENRSHPRQKLALAVVEMLGHHRPMEIEIDRVDG